MSTAYIVFLVLFIIILSIFAYINTRDGLVRALNALLRIAIPMLLSGIIVKISHFIPNHVMMVDLIIGGIGTVIFFIVLQSVITNPEKTNKNGLLNIFFGFILGLAQGWLVIGFLVLYLDFFKIISIHNIIPGSFFDAIVTPVKWILFLDFINF